MGKPRSSTDGRLKANRDFRRFMLAAVYTPQVLGTFKSDPTVCPIPAPAQRVMSARSLDDLADSDLVAMLRFAMIHEGVRPFSTADNILADLRQRIARREAQGRS